MGKVPGYGSGWHQIWDGRRYYFFSILGMGGDCYGIAVYKGYAGLNSFLMLVMQQRKRLQGLEEYKMRKKQ